MVRFADPEFEAKMRQFDEVLAAHGYIRQDHGVRMSPPSGRPGQPIARDWWRKGAGVSLDEILSGIVIQMLSDGQMVLTVLGGTVKVSSPEEVDQILKREESAP